MQCEKLIHFNDRDVGSIGSSISVQLSIVIFKVQFKLQVVLPLLQDRFEGFKHPTLKASQPVDYDVNYYDGCPIVGRHPIQEHIWMACGFRGLGAHMAPAVARGLMEMIYDKGFETIDLSRFAFDRILTGAQLEENFLTRHKETAAMMEKMA